MMLGCHVDVDGKHTRPRPDCDALPESVVQQLLLGAMRTESSRPYNPSNEYDCLSILFGLSKNERWREALTSMSDSYKFTVLLARYLDTMHNFRPFHNGDGLHATMGPSFQAVLHAWCDVEADRSFSSYMLARALFGDAWCSLFIDSTVGYWRIKDLVKLQRPPFLAGLVSAQDEVVSCDLPLMLESTSGRM
jgi:hypothetical protein